MKCLSNIRTIVTGATGFVGLRTVSKLLRDTTVKELTLAIRAESTKAAQLRLENLMKQHPFLGIQDQLHRVHIVAYDGSRIPLQPGGGDYDALLNLGADTSWTKSLDTMMSANYEPLASAIDSKATPKHVVHCSTAYAVPLEKVSLDHVTAEESFPEGENFFSSYAEAKYHTERKIESDLGHSDTSYTIVRPSTVGASFGMDSVPRGWATDLKGFAGFHALTHPSTAVLHTIPGRPDYKSNVIPVDHVANIIIAALHENVVRNAPSSIEYIHAAPGTEIDLTYEQQAFAVNPNIPFPSAETPGSSVRFADHPLFAKAGKVLWKVGGKPFQFSSTKHESLLSRLLSEEEQALFPMSWCSDDDLQRYARDCAKEAAQKFLAQRADLMAQA